MSRPPKKVLWQIDSVVTPAFKRAARAAYWILPPLFCLWVYWAGLRAWFQQDDFAWLRLRLDIDNWRDLLRVVFEPRAQGTIRPLSERLFFLVFSAIFGLDALPFRIWAFLTQFANIALMMAITLRLTGSRLAGFLAAILWLANPGLAKTMTWTSGYNQLACGLFVLASFYLLLRYLDTGRRRYWLGQWIVFLAGFGVQELNVVYPALAAAYTLCCARRHFRGTLPLFIPSLVYAAVHSWVAPTASGGTYGLYFDGAIPVTFARYWAWALTAPYLEPAWLLWGLATLLSAALGWLAFAQARRGEFVPLFFLAWFAILIAPVLPLREHIIEYYLTLPTLGLAMLGGFGFARCWKAQWPLKVTAVVLAGAYLAASLPATRSVAQWNYQRSRDVRTLVRGVARAAELHPRKLILLAGVSDDLFWTGIIDQPFRLVGANAVYLTPGSELSIEPHPEFGEVADFVMPPGAALRALEGKRGVVYAVAPDRLYNVTPFYERLARSAWALEEPRYVDVGQSIFAEQLGPTWREIHGRHRWMPKRATVRLGGPRAAAERLYVTGYCPAALVAQGPLSMTISVDGTPLPPVALSTPDSQFSFVFPLPARTVGKPAIEVAVEVAHTITDPLDGRQLGAAFGTFVIR